MKYDDYEAYQDFNEVKLFTGTVPQALAAGFDFNAKFTKVEDGEAAGSIENTEVVDTDYKVVVLSEKVDVKVDGTIKYMSSDYTSVKAKDTVSIQIPEEAGDGEELSLVYIVYK